MICFDVFRNGKRLCRAGVGDYGVLSAILTWVCRRGENQPAGKDFSLHVGGLYRSEPTVDVHPNWVDLYDIQVGDEITIRVVESAEVDEPSSETRTTEEEIREQQIRYYESIKKELEEHGDA
jgi:hypothetical protein